MNESQNALPQGGLAKPTQKRFIPEEKYARCRRFLLLTFGWCLLTADAALWRGPCTGMAVCILAWYALCLAWKGRPALRSSRVLLGCNLLLALTFVFTSNWYFRYWNLLALMVLVPVQLFAGGLPWWEPAMFLERFGGFLRGLFGNIWACFAAAAPAGQKRDAKRTAAIAAGCAGALVLVSFLLPALVSADALFAAATADLRMFIQRNFAACLGDAFWAFVLTPFAFGLLYSLEAKTAVQPKIWGVPAFDGLMFALVLAALDVLYLLFLAVQSAGLAGGITYLAERGISYAEWARSGFFQMVGVTAVNLSVLLAALVFSNRAGRAWTAVRALSAALLAESLALLASAAWRMTMYVSAYGLSFKRFMTYWGMIMMALFFLAAAVKIMRPDFRWCRSVFPLVLAGWLVVNCVPVDYLVAKNQVDRYLSRESFAIDVHYLAYSLSYDTLAQLERLDQHAYLSRFEGSYHGGDTTLAALIRCRRDAARYVCGDWRTWSLSACLAARK